MPETAVVTEHRFEIDVNIFDTDCFGVMWHGAYIKWLEMGRVKLFEDRGLMLSKPGEPGGYIYPVAEQNLKFRAPAPFGDKLAFTTRLEVVGSRLLFHQTAYSLTYQRTTLEAVTTVAVLDEHWKLCRRIPAGILERIS